MSYKIPNEFDFGFNDLKMRYIIFFFLKFWYISLIIGRFAIDSDCEIN